MNTKLVELTEAKSDICYRPRPAEHEWWYARSINDSMSFSLHAKPFATLCAHLFLSLSLSLHHRHRYRSNQCVNGCSGPTGYKLRDGAQPANPDHVPADGTKEDPQPYSIKVPSGDVADALIAKINELKEQ